MRIPRLEWDSAFPYFVDLRDESKLIFNVLVYGKYHPRLNNSLYYYNNNNNNNDLLEKDGGTKNCIYKH